MIPNYSDPIVTLNQVYRAREAGVTPVLGACIIGPNYLIRDYEGFGEDLRLDDETYYPFSFEGGLLSRPLPGKETGDESYKNVKVLVKNARLCYETFAVSDSKSTVFEAVSDALDKLKIKTQQDSDSALEYVNFSNPATPYAAGDEVVVTLKDAESNSYSQVCQIKGFGKDVAGDLTICTLSKVRGADDTITKVTFFKYNDCYVDSAYVPALSSNNELTI